MKTKTINLKKLVRSIIVVILMIFIIMIMFQNTVSGDNIPEYQTIVVEAGDTLWNIAREYNSEDRDIRDKVDEIKELNNIKGTIKTGQSLRIRVK